MHACDLCEPVSELRKYQICVQKTDFHDQLGMDVKHRLGRLVVLAIRRDGAVDRSNALAEQQGLPSIKAFRSDIDTVTGTVWSRSHDSLNRLELRFSYLFLLCRDFCGCL